RLPLCHGPLESGLHGLGPVYRRCTGMPAPSLRDPRIPHSCRRLGMRRSRAYSLCTLKIACKTPIPKEYVVTHHSILSIPLFGLFCTLSDSVFILYLLCYIY